MLPLYYSIIQPCCSLQNITFEACGKKDWKITQEANIFFQADNQPAKVLEPNRQFQFLYQDKLLSCVNIARETEETTTKIVFSYDQQQRLINKKANHSNGEVVQYLYHYNEAGLLEKLQWINFEKKISYSQDGQPSNISFFQNDELSYLYQYSYNQRGLLHAWVERSSDQQIKNLRTYSYNENELLEEYQLFDGNKVLQQQLWFEYPEYSGSDWLERICYDSINDKKPLNKLKRNIVPVL